jgi:hypothetical protein
MRILPQGAVRLNWREFWMRVIIDTEGEALALMLKRTPRLGGVLLDH